MVPLERAVRGVSVPEALKELGISMVSGSDSACSGRGSSLFRADFGKKLKGWTLLAALKFIDCPSRNVFDSRTGAMFKKPSIKPSK